MQNNLNTLINTITNAPVWIKEVILNDLRSHLESEIPNISNTPAETIYALYVPQITFKGKKELEMHEKGHELNIYKFLSGTNSGFRVADITINNFWTLEEASRYMIACIKNEYIKMPENLIVYASALYMANEIRLGEYAKRVNLIDVTQLDAALRRQKELNKDTNSYQKLGNVLIDLGYIVNDDIVKILQIKDESQKRFMLALDSLKSQEAGSAGFKELESKIEQLARENAILKEKLRAIFKIQSKPNADEKV